MRARAETGARTAARPHDARASRTPPRRRTSRAGESPAEPAGPTPPQGSVSPGPASRPQPAVRPRMPTASLRLARVHIEPAFGLDQHRLALERPLRRGGSDPDRRHQRQRVEYRCEAPFPLVLMLPVVHERPGTAEIDSAVAVLPSPLDG